MNTAWTVSKSEHSLDWGWGEDVRGSVQRTERGGVRT